MWFGTWIRITGRQRDLCDPKCIRYIMSNCAVNIYFFFLFMFIEERELQIDGAKKQFDYYQFEITPMSKKFFSYEWLKLLFNMLLANETIARISVQCCVTITFYSFELSCALRWVRFNEIFYGHFSDWGGAFTQRHIRAKKKSKVHILYQQHMICCEYSRQIGSTLDERKCLYRILTPKTATISPYDFKTKLLMIHEKTLGSTKQWSKNAVVMFSKFLRHKLLTYFSNAIYFLINFSSRNCKHSTWSRLRERDRERERNPLQASQ